MAEYTPEEGYIIALARIEDVATTGKTKLDLSGLSLRDLPKEIEKLPHLTSLIASYNQFTSLTKNIGLLKKLHSLDLYGNNLVSLPKEIANLRDLQELDISDNCFSTFPIEILQNSRLEFLSLFGNQIKFIPPEVRRLKNLVVLWMGLNNEGPYENPELRRMLLKRKITENQIYTLPFELKELTKLQELHIANHSLSIPPEILEKNDPKAILS